MRHIVVYRYVWRKPFFCTLPGGVREAPKNKTHLFIRMYPKSKKKIKSHPQSHRNKKKIKNH